MKALFLNAVIVMILGSASVTQAIVAGPDAYSCADNYNAVVLYVSAGAENRIGWQVVDRAHLSTYKNTYDVKSVNTTYGHLVLEGTITSSANENLVCVDYCTVTTFKLTVAPGKDASTLLAKTVRYDDSGTPAPTNPAQPVNLTCISIKY